MTGLYSENGTHIAIYFKQREKYFI